MIHGDPVESIEWAQTSSVSPPRVRDEPEKNRGRRVGIIPDTELAASTLAAAVEREQSAPGIAKHAAAALLEIAGAPVEDPQRCNAVTPLKGNRKVQQNQPVPALSLKGEGVFWIRTS